MPPQSKPKPLRSPLNGLKEQLKPVEKALRQRPKPAPPRPLANPETDGVLFRRATADVTPLRPTQRVEHPPRHPYPTPKQRLRENAQVMQDAMSDFWPWDEIESGEELLYLRPGQRTDTLKKLRKGLWVVQAQLDLHGFNSDAARQAVGEFLHQCVHHDRRCVRIIHGKGLGSKNREPVLKLKLRNWLVQRDEVLAFAQARPVDGGAGAILVLLRGRRN